MEGFLGRLKGGGWLEKRIFGRFPDVLQYT